MQDLRTYALISNLQKNMFLFVISHTTFYCVLKKLIRTFEKNNILLIKSLFLQKLERKVHSRIKIYSNRTVSSLSSF